MPVTIKSANMKYKSSSTGNYVGVNAISDNTTADQIAAINTAGADQVSALEQRATEIEQNWPSDYSDLTESVSELWPSLAPAFSASTAYAAGQYVTYDSGLYRFTSYHAAGAWNSSHVTAVNLGGEIAENRTNIARKQIRKTQSLTGR